MAGGRWGWVVVAALWVALPAWAGEATLSLNQRKLVTLHATLKGESPAERVEAAGEALAVALAASGPDRVERVALPGDPPAVRLKLNDVVVLHLVPEDLGGARSSALLESAAVDVERRLRVAVAEAREARDPRAWAVGLAVSLLASAVALGVLWGLVVLRRRALKHLLRHWGGADASTARPWWQVSGEHAIALLRGLAGLASWGVLLVVLDVWASVVLRQFALTRVWGERAGDWLLEQLLGLGQAALGAVPGLLTAGLIFLFALGVQRVARGVLERVERGEIYLAGLDADTAGPTQRLVSLVVWLFAVAMAYPYLPGASSEAFKGVTVLTGVMVSLGASGVVGQVMAGLSLMYSRALRVGEYVRIGEVEGTVTALGVFATRLHTGLGEEVSLPNAVVFSQPVRNFSRLVEDDGQYMLHTAVTIGYATPWRQVHAMLLEAARRTPGVLSEPVPYVVQTALSDFYVEYRLCAQGSRAAPRRRAEAMSQLHSHIQDVFNENGVQIMSPHYLADPAAAQVVPAGPWFAPEGEPLRPPR
ncbi:MAG: mechanosensitive ion channel [Burkholderiales bacterium]|uniref:mechanosensitive ion channel domain-containing protein n=1 Tax=Roseateles sp. TaxID=1971397 RepID=UPI000F91664A|nr:MAG: mechanosensitive ion channel [Burkholderiales bacterium]